MRVVLQELSADVPPSGERADLLWFASLLDLAAGRVDASRVARAQAADAERALPAERRRPAFDDVTDWFAATLPLPYADSLLASARQRAAAATPLPDAAHPAFVSEMALGAPIRFEPLRQYALGMLSLRLRDSASARDAAARLAHLATSPDATALVRDLDRGLRAALAWQARRPADALRLLEALECRDSQGDVDVTPFDARANERFLHGEVLAALGRDAEALQWFASLGTGSVTELPLRAPAELRQAAIHERLGHRADAVRHYERFLALWRDADPALRATADSARRRLAALRAE
jgi:tetratricopeptide (TPR) repeat protein